MSMVFLSYSRKDTATMERVKQALLDAGITVWTDEGLRPGTGNWQRAIEAALQKCNGMVVILSPDSYKSKWVQREINRADHLGKPIFPLLGRGKVEDSRPLILETAQLQYLEKDFTAAMGKLLREFEIRGWLDGDKITEDITTENGVDEEDAIRTWRKIPRWGIIAGGIIVVFMTILVIFFPEVFGIGGDPDGAGTGSAVVTTDLSSEPVISPTITATSDINGDGTITPTATSLTATPVTPTVTATPDGSTSRINSIDGAEMVLVAEGEFEMGIEHLDYHDLHSVYLDTYWIYKMEVRNQQYADFLNQMGNQIDGGYSWLGSTAEDVRIHQVGGEWRADLDYENHPVVEVTWYGAAAYCEWSGGRLPTEAEWEKAARGTDGRVYPWGEGIDFTLANYGYNVGETTAVRSYLAGASPYEVLNMAGNVWEWVSDFYREKYYQDSPYENPSGPETGNQRVVRGGSWTNPHIPFLFTYHRWNANPNKSYPYVGFRCVVPVEP